MKQLCEEGYLPMDWVKIQVKNLTGEQAYMQEKEFLHSHGTTIFNRQSGERNYQAKLTDKEACEIYIKTKKNQKLHKELALEYGVSRTAISMISSRKQWRAATACLL